MRSWGIYILVVALLILNYTCKKKTTIKIKVINPALNESVQNATVVLIEKKGEAGGGLFSGDAECSEVATAITDVQGECFFDEEKLRGKSNYKYFCAVTESWGIKQPYTCGGRTSNFLAKGNSQEIILSDEQLGFLQIQLDNLLNPSIPGDSLFAEINFLKYYDPVFDRVKGGGRVYVGMPHHGDNGYPYPNKLTGPVKQTPGGKYEVRIYKKKLGIAEERRDTIKIFPNQTKKYTIVW